MGDEEPPHPKVEKIAVMSRAWEACCDIGQATVFVICAGQGRICWIRAIMFHRAINPENSRQTEKNNEDEAWSGYISAA